MIAKNLIVGKSSFHVIGNTKQMIEANVLIGRCMQGHSIIFMEMYSLVA